MNEPPDTGTILPMGEIEELSAALENGARTADIVRLFEERIGLPLANALADEGIELLNGHGHATDDSPKKQFVFWEPFRLPDDLQPRVWNAARTREEKRPDDGFFNLAFVASHRWQQGKHSALPHVRWGLFLESREDKHKNATPVFRWLLNEIPDGHERMSVQPLRPVPGFTSQSPSLWHVWVGREVVSTELGMFTSCEDLVERVREDLVALFRAASK